MKFFILVAVLLGSVGKLTSAYQYSIPSVSRNGLFRGTDIMRNAPSVALPDREKFVSANILQKRYSCTSRGPAALSSNKSVSSSTQGSDGGKKSGIDVSLMIYFLCWYIGSYYYNVTSKLALNAAGGATGFPMTLASLQLGVGCIYSMFLWMVPNARKTPSITLRDFANMFPVAFCFMGAHCASVFSHSAASVSFAEIVKAAEPAFAAVVSQYFYKRRVSKAKWLCIPLVIGGVILASVTELSFSSSALISGCVANLFAALKGSETKKMMETEGIKDRLGSTRNQFSVTLIMGFLMSIPIFLFLEGRKFGEFLTLFKTNGAVSKNLVACGLWWYGYNECATMTLKKTGPVTYSVANTAKRVIVIVGVAIVLGESLNPMKILGSAIGITGVLLYSIIDILLSKNKS